MTRTERNVTGFFFITLLLTGVSLFRDYGIHVDEFNNQNFGEKWMKVVLDPSARVRLDQHDYIHGPFFELILSAAGRAMRPQDPRPLILMRHLATFLSFVLGVAAFYFLARRCQGSWKWGLLGAFLLAGHPRIFCDAFYNSVDIPFLSLYAAAFLTMLRYLERPSADRAAWHALASAALVSTRLVGLVLPALTLVLAAVECLRPGLPGKERRKTAGSLALYALLLAALTMLFWPFLWHNPPGRFMAALRATRFVHDAFPPVSWDYTLRWILVTTPLSVCALFAAGVFAAAKDAVLKPSWADIRGALVPLALFFVPVLAPAFFKTTLFDGWRHHYFVWPVVVLLALRGLRAVWGRPVVRHLALAALLVDAALTASFMVKYHPYQCIYANPLAGSRLQHAKYSGALDYWGLAYQRALERILQRDRRPLITVMGVFMPAENIGLLPPEHRRRLRYVIGTNNLDKTDYLLTNFRNSVVSRRPFDGQEVDALEYRGQKFLAVYRRTQKNPTSS